MAILQEIKASQKEYLLGHKRIYMNKDVDERLNKALYLFFKVKNEKAMKLQKQIRVFVFRKKVLRKLKILVKRKNIWRKIEQK